MRLAVALVLVPALALAEPREPDPPPADQARGLEESGGIDATDAALFVPRAVLAVPRIALQAVSLPVIGAIRLEERHHVFSRLEDLFYNDARTAAIIPYGTFDSSFGPSAGLIAFHDDLFGHRESLRLRAKFAGTESQSYQLGFRAGTTSNIGALVRWETADDLLFHGVGAGGPESRYSQERFLALLRAGQRTGPVEFSATGIYNHRDFSGGGTIEDEYDTMSLEGYADGVETLELQTGVALATRRLRAELFGGGVANGPHYFHWGAEVTGFVPLWAEGRQLVLRAAAEGVEGDDVPFTDLPRLGGPNRLRGYGLDRFRGTTALLGTVEYRYPVHQMVAGAAFVDVGKVTDGDWRAGGGLGLVVHSAERSLLSIELAYGEGLQLVVSTDPLRAFAKKDTEL